jgi:hypothetical protein
MALVLTVLVFANRDSSDLIVLAESASASKLLVKGVYMVLAVMVNVFATLATSVSVAKTRDA